MHDAFYNGFPILYSDTSTYLNTGFEYITPSDRPITYGYFLRIASLNGFSLWFAVFFQSLILSYLIHQLFKLIFGENINVRFLVTMLFLSLFTGVSWVSSQLVSDIFTPITVLCLVLILFGNNSKRKLYFLYFLFFISCAMHVSHLILFIGLLVLILLFKKFIFSENIIPKKKIIVLFCLITFGLITMGHALARSRHVFFMGAMVEHGILKKYLDENCGTKDYKLCQYKDSLNIRAWQFVWEDWSPLYKLGNWNESKKEINEIIFATFITPKYLWIHVKESIKATIDQLEKFRIGDGNGAFHEETRLYKRIQLYLPNEMEQYRDSKQYNEELSMIDFGNTIIYWVMIVSIIVLLVLSIINRSLFSKTFLSVIIILILAILLNAWDCGTFANAIDRLGCRMMWMIPLLSLLTLFRFLDTRKRNQI